MTQAISTVTVPAALMPKTAVTAATTATSASPLATGEQVQMSAVAAPPHRKTLSEQLLEVGKVKEGGGFLARTWNWLNTPKVEAGREFAGAFIHHAPNLIVEMSKHSGVAAAAGEVAIGGEAVAASSIAVTGGLATAASSGGRGVAKALGAAGSSGLMAVLAKVGAVTGSVTGVISLLRDMVKGRHGSERPIDQSMIVSGGFLAVTGSVIALCGGMLPGAVIGLVGTLIHATGLYRKSEMQDEDKIKEHFDKVAS